MRTSRKLATEGANEHCFTTDVRSPWLRMARAHKTLPMVHSTCASAEVASCPYSSDSPVAQPGPGEAGRRQSAPLGSVPTSHRECSTRLLNFLDFLSAFL